MLGYNAVAFATPILSVLLPSKFLLGYNFEYTDNESMHGSATIEIFARLQLIIYEDIQKVSSATIEIFARLQPEEYIKQVYIRSATIEIFARLQLNA